MTEEEILAAQEKIRKGDPIKDDNVIDGEVVASWEDGEGAAVSGDTKVIILGPEGGVGSGEKNSSTRTESESDDLVEKSRRIRELFTQEGLYYLELKGDSIDELLSIKIGENYLGSDDLLGGSNVINSMEIDLRRGVDGISYEQYSGYLKAKGIVLDFSRVKNCLRGMGNSKRMVDGGFWNERDILTRGYSIYKKALIVSRALGLSLSEGRVDSLNLIIEEIQSRVMLADEVLSKNGYSNEDKKNMSPSARLNRAVRISEMLEIGRSAKLSLIDRMHEYDRKDPADKKSWIASNAQRLTLERNNLKDSGSAAAPFMEEFIRELRYDFFGLRNKGHFMSTYSSVMDSGHFKGLMTENIFDPFNRSQLTLKDLIDERFSAKRVGKLGSMERASIIRFAEGYPKWGASSDSLGLIFSNRAITNPDYWIQQLSKYKTGKSAGGDAVNAAETLNISSVCALAEMSTPNYPELEAYGDAYRLTTKIWNIVIKESGFVKRTDVNTWDELINEVENKLGIELDRDEYEQLTPEAMAKKTVIDGYIHRSLVWTAMFGYGNVGVTYADGKPLNALATGAVCVQDTGGYFNANSSKLKIIAAWKAGYSTMELKLREGDTLGDPFDDPTKFREVALNFGKWLQSKDKPPYSQFSGFRTLLYGDELPMEMLGRSDLNSAMADYVSYITDAKVKVYDYLCSIPDPAKFGDFVSELYKDLCLSYKTNWPTEDENKMKTIALAVTKRVAWFCAATRIMSEDSLLRTKEPDKEVQTDDLLQTVRLLSKVDLALDKNLPSVRTTLFSDLDVVSLRDWTNTLTLAHVNRAGLHKVLSSIFAAILRDRTQSRK